MRRPITWLLDGLPFDPRSRRAIDETLLDWAHEAGSGRSRFRRGLIDVRNLLAVLRVAAESTAGEVIRVPYGWLAGRVMLFAVPFSVGLVGLVASEPFSKGRTDLAVGMIGWLLPQYVMSAFPAALLLALAWRPGERDIPGAGVATTALLTMAFLKVVILPALHPMLIAPYIRASRADLHASAVVWSTSELMAARLAFAGEIVIALTSVLLGACLARRYRLRGLAWLVVVPALYVLAPTALHFALWPNGQGPVATAILIWLFCGVTFALAVILKKRTASAAVQGRI